MSERQDMQMGNRHYAQRKDTNKGVSTNQLKLICKASTIAEFALYSFFLFAD